MPPRISIAAFIPHHGKEAELIVVIRDRLPLLRALGLATNRLEILMRSRDGAIISISEWSSEEAIEKAHHTPEVLALWKRFEACSNFTSLTSLTESQDLFATFTPID